jgi:hypothetical protein
MGSEFQIAPAQQHRHQEAEWQRDQIGSDHHGDFGPAVQGYHPGAKMTDKALI